MKVELMASVFARNACDRRILQGFSPPVGQGKHLCEELSGTQRALLVKPHALSGNYFYLQLKEPWKHNTFHLKQAGQKNHELTSITLHK